MFVEAIEKSARVHDYNTAEMLLSFLSVYSHEVVDERVLGVVHPEQKAEMLTDKWDSYLSSHPQSSPL